MENQPTNQDILTAVNTLTTEVKSLGQRMIGVEESNNVLGQRMTGVEGSINILSDRVSDIEKSNQEILENIQTAFTEVEQGMNSRFEKTDQRFENIDRRFDKLENNFAEMRGDLVAAIRKEDTKISTLTTKLGARNVLPLTDVSEVLAMEPFPKSV